MSIFSFFKGNKRSKKPKGMIAYFQLEDWWNEEFSDEERRLIEEVYQPMGGSSLTSGDIRSTSNSSIAFLHTLAGWFQKSEHRYIAQKCLKKAESLVDTNTRALDLHFLMRKIRAQRHKDITDIPLLKVVNATSQKDRIEAIMGYLVSRGNAKPRKVKTLSNSINSLFMRSLDDAELEGLIAELVKRKIVIISNETNVSYKLPLNA